MKTSLIKHGDDPDYHHFASDYDGRSWQWYRHLVSACVARSIPGKILDIGCGSGLFVECAVKFGLDAVGIDGAPEAIEEGLQRNPALPLRVHDLRQPLPFETSSISTIMCHQVVEHLLPDTCSKLFRECHRVLRQGGAFLVYTPSKYNHKEALDPCHINLYSPSQLEDDLGAVGFRVQVLSKAPKTLWPGGRIGGAMGAIACNVLGLEYFADDANMLAYKLAEIAQASLTSSSSS